MLLDRVREGGWDDGTTDLESDGGPAGVTGAALRPRPAVVAEKPVRTISD